MPNEFTELWNTNCLCLVPETGPPKSGLRDEAKGHEAHGVVVERTAADVRGRAGADVRAHPSELADSITAGCGNLGATGFAEGRNL